MKRIFRNTTAMALMLVMLLIPSIVLAGKEYVGDSSERADTPYVTYQKAEITDIDILYARALSGKHETQSMLGDSKLALTSDSGAKVYMQTYSTNQVLKREVTANDSTVDTIAETVFAIVPATVTPGGNTSTSDETYDSSSRCVKLYSTVYYKKGSTAKADGAIMYKVTGGFTILDENVTVTNKKYEYECNGIDIDTDKNVTNQRASGSMSSMSMSKSTGFTKYIDTTAGHTIRYIISCKVSRGGSSWNAELINGK